MQERQQVPLVFNTTTASANMALEQNQQAVWTVTGF
jgi:hypothetical protein